MIKTFRCKDTEALFNRQRCPRFQSIENAARRKLIMLNNAQSLQDLRAPPGNRLKELHGDRRGQHSIRINISGASVSSGESVTLTRWRSSIITEEIQR